MEFISDNWINDKTKKFLKKLSFNGYILAGNSVANMIEKIPLQGDLDFWAKEKHHFLKAFDEMYPYYDNFKIYPSMIEMISNNDLPKVNLIYTSLNNDKLINRFDFDYCRCYWTPSSLVASDDCRRSIKTKFIKYPENWFHKRILKAINYGYSFGSGFWFWFLVL